MLDFGVCWWDERKGGVQLFEGQAERKKSRSRAGPWLCSWVFPAAAVHVESSWDFYFRRHVFREFEGRRGKEMSEKLVAWNWAWPMGSGTDQTVQQNVRLHLQHGTHQQG